MCHENKMGAAKEQHPYINQVDIVGGTGWNRGWNRVEQWNSSGTSGTVTRPLFITVFTDICRATSPAHSSEAVTNHTSG